MTAAEQFRGTVADPVAARVPGLDGLRGVAVADPAAARVPGLDGLRGVAVAWVVAFHLWPEVVRGGWLGVGLFFTLSGYLILGLIDAEVSATGRLRLGRFMARRVRRLMPAGLVTIAATLALTAVFTDDPMHGVGLDALTATLNVFNWRAAADPGDYAAIFEMAASPLDHFWSLAIEEQFYLIVPTAVALTRRPVHVVAAMAVAGLVGVALWWGSSDAYVSTPVRALEIAAGSALALATARSAAVRRLLRWEPGLPRAVSAASVAAVIAALAAAELALAWLRPDHGAVFRGGPQIMALCWVVLLAASLPRGPLAPLVSLAPLRWLGTRSYAIYLFHWPLIELTDWSPVTVVAVTLLAAETSYRLMEMPVRHRGGLSVVAGLAGAAASVAAVSAIVAIASSPARGAGEQAEGVTELPEWLAAHGQGGTPTTIAQTEPHRAEPAQTEPHRAEPAQTEPHRAEPAQTEPLVPVAAVPIVTVLGESTATHMADGLRSWADTTRTMAVVDRSRAACSPVMTADKTWRVLRTGDDANPRNVVEHDTHCRYNQIQPGSMLVLVIDHAMPLVDHERADGSWASVLDQDLATDLDDAYRALVQEAREMNARVVFTTAPRWLHVRDDSGDPLPGTDPARAVAYNQIVRTLVKKLQDADTRLAPSLLETADVLNSSGHNGRYARSDGSHIDFDRSETFATEVIGPALLALSAVDG